MRKTGRLKPFNDAYRAHRAAATASGWGFMSYGTVLGRLRLALVPILTGGSDLGAASATLFASIFASR
jgi:hypothetical protein